MFVMLCYNGSLNLVYYISYLKIIQFCIEQYCHSPIGPSFGIWVKDFKVDQSLGPFAVQFVTISTVMFHILSTIWHNRPFASIHTRPVHVLVHVANSSEQAQPSTLIYLIIWLAKPTQEPSRRSRHLKHIICSTLTRLRAVGLLAIIHSSAISITGLRLSSFRSKRSLYREFLFSFG